VTTEIKFILQVLRDIFGESSSKLFEWTTLSNLYGWEWNHEPVDETCQYMLSFCSGIHWRWFHLDYFVRSLKNTADMLTTNINDPTFEKHNVKLVRTKEFLGVK